MNFELKTMNVAQAAAEKCDLLVLLVPEGFAPGKDALGAVVAQALKAKDLDTKPGKSLQLYQATGVAARRVVLAGVGAGDARAVRQAWAAVAPALKLGAPKRAVVCLAGEPSAAAVEAVVRGVAQASYVYTATKPKAEARTLARVVVGVHDAHALHIEMLSLQWLKRGPEAVRSAQHCLGAKRVELPQWVGEVHGLHRAIVASSA